VRSEPFGARGQTEDVSINVRKRHEKIGGGHDCTREVRIGLGSTSAIVGALAFGFTLGLVVKYGLADAGPRRVPARLSDSETASSTSFDLQRRHGSQVPSSSGMRLASHEMSVPNFPAEDNDPSALARPPVFFGDGLLLDGRLDSFDERFGGVSSHTAPATTSDYERGAADTGQPSLDLREKATGQSASGRSAPKPAAAPTLASHAMDFDLNTTGQSVAGVIPAILPVAETTGATPSEILSAFIVAAEVASRLFRAAPQGWRNSGWHGTGTIGTQSLVVG
jgi:hypothetical protein